MIAYLRLDHASGTCVVGFGFAEGDLSPDAIVSPDQDNPRRFLNHYLVEGELLPRPSAPELVAIDQGYRITECPGGTLIEIVDLIGEEPLAELITTEAEVVDFALPDAGSYLVDVTPPLPGLPVRYPIEVA